MGTLGSRGYMFFTNTNKIFISEIRAFEVNKLVFYAEN